MSLDPNMLMGMLRTADLGGMISTVRKDSKLMGEFMGLLPQDWREAIQEAEKKNVQKTTTGKSSNPHTLEEYVQQFCALGLPKDQAMMAAMDMKGATTVEIAVYYGKRYSELQLSPQDIHFMLTKSIKPRIHTLLGVTEQMLQEQTQQQAPVQTQPVQPQQAPLQHQQQDTSQQTQKV